MIPLTFEEKIHDLRMDLMKTDGSNWDGRVRSLVLTKLEEAELWASKIEKVEPSVATN